MRVADGDDWLELDEARFAAGRDGSQADDDLLLNVGVSVQGFSATDQAWVTRREWEEFLASLRQLEERRRGEAVLVGASPQELRIRFYVYDSAGHTAVSGQLARPHYRTGNLERLCLIFSMTFDPGSLRHVLDQLSGLGQRG